MITRIAPPLALAALLLAGCSTPEQIRSPVWAGPAQTPGGQEFTPERATRQAVNGHVMLLCRSHAVDGHVSDCRVAYESPPGWGFGSAAMRMAANFNVNRSTTPPRPDGLVLVPIRFCGDGTPNCPPPVDGPWPIRWGDPRLRIDSLPPPVARP